MGLDVLEELTLLMKRGFDLINKIEPTALIKFIAISFVLVTLSNLKISNFINKLLLN